MPKDLAGENRRLQQRAEELEDKLTRLEERFSTLFNASPVALAIARLKDNQLIDVNNAWEKMTGLTREEAVGHTSREINILVNPNGRDRIIHKLLEQTRAQSFEIQIRHKSGKVIDVLMSVELIEMAGEQYVLSFAQDITVRKEAEEKLRESEERYRTVVEDQTEVISRFLADDTCIFANDVYCHFFGKTREELIGKKWQPMVVPEDVPMIKERLRALSSANPVVIIENRVSSGLGRVHWMQFVNRGIFSPEGKLLEIQSVGRDITERKRAERVVKLYQKKLQGMGSKMVLSAEKERRYLATEVHDRVAQALAVAKMKLGGFPRSGLSPQRKSLLGEIENLIGMTVQETRSLIFEISPPVLYELGLEAALEWLAERFQEQHGIPVKMEIKGRRRNERGDLQTILFQAVRELLNNIRKHSQAEQAKIILEYGKEEMRITVSDDGAGFVSSSKRPEPANHSFGLFNIREQIKHIGGNFKIMSSPGKGAQAFLAVPTKSGAKRKEGDGWE